MKEGFVNIHGQPINWHAQSLNKQPKRAVAASEPKAMGFRVVGYPQGFLAEAQRLANELHAAGKGKPWDEVAFLRGAKPQRISPRNYEIRGAAEVFAQLAERGGWERVRVEEVTRGDVEGARQKLAGF